MVRIKEYQFGRISVNGRVLHRDLVIYPDHIKENWWRTEGHKLQPEDLEDLASYKPETLIVGTGYLGLMHVSSETIEWAKSLGIDLIAKPTREAVELFNNLAKTKKAVAALHLTC
jgi:hypothetical protein